MTVVAMAGLGRYLYCNVPFYRNDEGNPRGTGVEEFHYPDGSIKVATEYECGVAIRSTWYKPDGSVFKVTEWDDGRGIWYMLRDDGSLKSECMGANDLMHGTMTYYDREGNIIGTEEYNRFGEKISGK